MRMLDDLKQPQALATLQRENEWAHGFVKNLLWQFERNPKYKLTGPQFKKLNEVHQQFVKRWSKEPWRDNEESKMRDVL